MFKKLHLQMTFFCLLITGTILITLSTVCFFILKSNIRQSAQVLFDSQRVAVINYLEHQDQISYEWLSQTSSNGQIILHIEDNGIPLLFSKLTQTDTEKMAIEHARHIAATDYQMNFHASANQTKLTHHSSFEIPSYLVSAIQIPAAKGFISIIMLFSLESSQYQMNTLSILFLLLDIIALLLLFIFSWTFTRRMLNPIEDNRKKQTAFIASASHELRTPLMVVSSCLSALEAAPERAGEFTEMIQSENKKMKLLLDDMLTLAKADNSAWSLNLQTIELDTMLINIFEKYHPLANSHHISLTFEIPPQLIPLYTCDPLRIEQAVAILLDNALNYSPVHGTVEIHLKEQKKTLEIHIIDHGPGIPEAEKEFIFERFYQISHSHDPKEHFGLGLSIATEIIQLHHGRLYVKDTPGGGSTFTIALPKTKF